VTIDLVLADPQPVVLEGLVHAFAAEPDFQVRACVQDGESALRAVREFKPDILVFDVLLMGRDGLNLLVKLNEEGLATHPVVFTGDHLNEVVEAMRLGVKGVVTKDMPLNLLVRCIREVQAGGKWLEKRVAAHAVDQFLKNEGNRHDLNAALTPREIAVARMVSEGLPNKKVASKLAITEGTVKLHLHRVYGKLNLTGRVALMQYMQRSDFK
jgi:DNA-binding NarL/FixJ family response regulator